jgi:multimeric flavodoxin WrbA
MECVVEDDDMGRVRTKCLLRRADAVEVRTVETSKADIRPCLGCFTCWRSEEGSCCLHDDMASVIESRVWADVTIWSFPLYYFSVPGPLKNLIDRQLPMALPFMEERTDGVGNGSHPSR